MDSRKAFTFVELLVVISAVALVAAFTISIGIRFFQTQTLDDATSNIIASLRRAYSQAVFQKNDSAFGVEFLSGSYVLFQGSSYASRVQSEDEIFTLSSGVSTSGITEVVFAKLTGAPSITGTLTVLFGSDSQTLNINAQGNVSR